MAVLKGFEELWVYAYGHGFGWPRQILSDNGGEFINELICEYLARHDVKLKSTAGYAPWSNGSTEKRHHIVDELFESAKHDNVAKLDDQQLLSRICFYRNCEVSECGYSPMQIIMGRNPSLFSAFNFDGTVGISDTGHEHVRKILALQNDLRRQVRKSDTERRLSKLMKMRANANTDAVYFPGQHILFFDPTDRSWKKGTLMYILNKTAHVDYNGQSRKVDITRLRNDENFDWRRMLEECMSENDDMSDHLVNTFSKFKNLNDTFDLRQGGRSKGVKFQEFQTSDEEEGPVQLQSKVKIMGRPEIGQNVAIKFTNKSHETFGKVIKVGSRSSQDSFDIISPDGIFRYLLVGKNVHYWRMVDESVDGLLWVEEDEMSEVELLFPITLTPRQQQGISEVEHAKSEEIEKWHKHKCMSYVQYSPYMKLIPLTWVVTKNVDSKSSNISNYKARLVVRGDLEKGSSRTDSPTAPKEIFRISLALAAIFNFKLATCDISSAFLQSSKPDRDIFLRPPKEWNGKAGIVWKAEKGIYGLKDAARLWFIKFRQFLSQLEVERFGDNESCFIKRDSGVIIGFILTHVDDILIIGTDDFINWFETRVKDAFEVSKFKYDKFRYTGIDINSNESAIILDQNFKLEEIQQFDISAFFAMGRLCDKGINTIQKMIGQLGWLSSQSRPELAFGTLNLSIIQKSASYDNLKEANKLIKWAKLNPLYMKFCRPSQRNFTDLQIWVFTDASHAKLEVGIKSSEGRFVFLVNTKSREIYVLNWRSALISQVCNSAKAAETHAVRNSSDELVYYTQLMDQIFGRKLPIYIFTDSKSLKDSIYSTTLVKEKSLRICIANIKQWIEDGTVDAIKWVDTKLQIADVLTKANAPSELIRDIFMSGKFSKQTYDSLLDAEYEVNAENMNFNLHDPSSNYPNYTYALLYSID